MQKLEIGMQTNHGFSLIEILVVLVIIAISTTFAVLSFGDFGHHHRIRLFAETILTDLKNIQHQTIIESTVYGVSFSEKNYAIVHLNQKKKWEKTHHSSSPKIRTPPRDVIYFLEDTQGKKISQITFYPTGSFNPFILFIGTHTSPQLIEIIGKKNGQIFIKNQSS